MVRDQILLTTTPLSLKLCDVLTKELKPLKNNNFNKLSPTNPQNNIHVDKIITMLYYM